MLLNLDKEKIDKFLDFLTWMALASIVVWVIAKGFGWINTPVFIVMYSVFSVVFLIANIIMFSNRIIWTQSRKY